MTFFVCAVADERALSTIYFKANHDDLSGT